MRTVKEVSEMTGISVRTLHYYDEIGLFTPTEVSEAGYRLYDDKALEALQQILFFREFDMPLKEIKAIMENPSLDKKQILAGQRKMLELKKGRLERLISGIDDILKGENKMDFSIFSKTELEEMFEDIASMYSEDQLQILASKFGSMEEYKQQYITNAGKPKTQEHFAKMVEWYGDKELVREFMVQTGQSRIGKAYGNRIEEIYRKIYRQKEQNVPVSDFSVKSLIGELEFVMKEFLQVKDDPNMLKNLMILYRTNAEAAEQNDDEFGKGMSEYFANAIEAFYGKGQK